VIHQDAVVLEPEHAGIFPLALHLECWRA
jgi:hypothetical protein